jgi:hypothetical protein
VHWVVQKLKAEVRSGRLTEELLETHQFEYTGVDDLYTPYNGYYGLAYNANFSLTLPDPYSPTGSSTFGLDNTTAFKVIEAWAAQIVPSSLVMPRPGKKSGPGDKFYYWVDPPRFIEVKNRVPPMLPWDTPNNVTAHMAEIVMVMNQVLRRSVLSQSHTHSVAIGKVSPMFPNMSVNR